MKTAVDEHSGGDAGQHGWIRQWRRCGTSIQAMWNDVDGKMGWKNGGVMGKYLQVTTTNLRVYHCSDTLGVGATTDLHGNLV